MTVYCESEHLCHDRRQNIVSVTIQNCGWSASQGGYVTRFLFEGRYYESMFLSPKHQDDICPHPEIRLEFDMTFLESLGLAYDEEKE